MPTTVPTVTGNTVPASPARGFCHLPRLRAALGMRDHEEGGGGVEADLVRSRSHVRQLADLFAERSIRATWPRWPALASSRRELTPFLPTVAPVQAHRSRPYAEDPRRERGRRPPPFCRSLVRHIAATAVRRSPPTPLALLLPGGRQDEEALRADLAAAQPLPSARRPMRSIVLPATSGTRSTRAPSASAASPAIAVPSHHGPSRPAGRDDDRARRVARLADTYAGLSPPPTTAWTSSSTKPALQHPASAFCARTRTAPLLEPPAGSYRVRLRVAARRAGFHLCAPAQLRPSSRGELRSPARRSRRSAHLAHSDGLTSMTMGDVSEIAIAEAPGAHRTR